MDITKFVLDCEARGLDDHTIQTYKGCVIDFLNYYSDPLTVGLDELRRYLKGLRSRELSGSTLKGYFAALSTYYEYLIFEKLIAYNPILPFRKRYLARIRPCLGGENTRQLISIDEMRLLIQAAITPLDLVILLLLAKTGIRRGELLALKIGDISLKHGIIRIPAKAKRSQRSAFIDEELHAALEKYISWRSHYTRSSRLLINMNGNKIQRDYPNKLIASLAEPLNLHIPRGALCDKLTPHCFRHWFTTWLYRAGMDKEFIKWLRGDSMSVESWEIYNQIDLEDVRQAYLWCIPSLLSFDMKLANFTKSSLKDAI
ncbi:MAG: tyrosine-type recombinase/integrase [Candidatus Methanoperedens sp.]|nr:tyrosine-type recombinase/integrase [Candidatus Methanoperedens sp.]